MPQQQLPMEKPKRTKEIGLEMCFQTVGTTN